jgi:hypothetical protein
MAYGTGNAKSVAEGHASTVATSVAVTAVVEASENRSAAGDDVRGRGWRWVLDRKVDRQRCGEGNGKEPERSNWRSVVPMAKRWAVSRLLARTVVLSSL